MGKKLDISKFMGMQKSNPKVFYGAIGGVVAVLLGVLMMGDGGGGDDPYADAFKGSPQAAAPADTGGASGNDSGFSFDDMMDEQPAASDTQDTQVSQASSPAPASVAKADKPQTRQASQPTREKKPSVPTRVKERVETALPEVNTGEKDIDSLIAQADSLVKDVILSYDVSAIHGDALKGTTTEEEKLRRVESLLDTLTKIQKKRMQLINATNDVKLSRINPQQAVRVEVAPLKQKISGLEAQVSQLKNHLDRLGADIKDVRKKRGATVVDAGEIRSAINANPKHKAKDNPPPKLLLVMKSAKGGQANLNYQGNVYAIKRVGQSVGEWTVVDIQSSFVVVKSDKTGKLYQLTTTGSVEVREKGK